MLRHVPCTVTEIPGTRMKNGTRVLLGPAPTHLCSEWPLSPAGFLPDGNLHPCPHLTHRARSPAPAGTQCTPSEKLSPIAGVSRRHEVHLDFFERSALFWGSRGALMRAKKAQKACAQGAAGDLRSHDPEARETEMPLCGKESGQACGRGRRSRSPSGSERLCPCVRGTATSPRSYEQTL